MGVKLWGALRPETKNKLRKVREDLDKQLKIEATKEKKEEVRLSSPLRLVLAEELPFRLRTQSAPRSIALNRNASPDSALLNRKR